MGFNIGGMIISKNFKSDKNVLLNKLGISEKNYIGEQPIMDATSVNEDESNFNIGYKGDYTIVMNTQKLIYDMINFNEELKEYNLLYFSIVEVSDVYKIILIEKGEIKRYFLEAEGETHEDQGEKLKGELSDNPSDDEFISDSIFDVIEEFSGIELNGEDFELKVETYSS